LISIDLVESALVTEDSQTHRHIYSALVNAPLYDLPTYWMEPEFGQALLRIDLPHPRQNIDRRPCRGVGRPCDSSFRRI
jgi:hypothetical protein